MREIRTPVLLVHGAQAHSCYFSRDAYAAMCNGPYADNKELMLVPDAVHTDLYDRVERIPFDRLCAFYQTALAQD